MKSARSVFQLLFAAVLAVLLLASGTPPGVRSAHSAGLDPVPLPMWRNEVVAPGVTFYNLGAPSFALDPAGYPHIAFGQNRLVHTWFDGLFWHSETVDSTLAWHRESVLAIDTAGVITISDIRNGRVFVRTLEPGGSWQTAEIPLPGLGSAESLSIALDSGGRPHLVAGPMYYSGTALFVYAYKTPYGWTTETVGTDYPASGPFSITLDSKDRPVILYEQYDESNAVDKLLIARRQGDSWQHVQIAAGSVIAGKSLVMDGQDKAHIVFSALGDGKLTYVRESENGWESIPVAKNGIDPGLALDGAERPHVIYTSLGRQVYATLVGSNWEEMILQEGWYNTLILDKAGAAHVVSLKPDLNYATNSSGQWLVSTLAVPESVGFQNALDLDSAGVPHILYHNTSTEELLLSSGGANGWQTELVAQVSPDGLDVEIAVDARDRIHIAYVDGVKDRLVVGLRKAGGWSLDPISAGGHHLSLAVGSDNRPQLILVQEETAQNARVVYWSIQGGDWLSEAVSEPDSGILDARLALDSENRPHVAYSTERNGSAYAVRQSANNWVTEWLPFDNVDDLALGPDDRPYMLHTVYVQDEVGGTYPPDNYYELRLAERAPYSWFDKAIYRNAGTARLAVDANNRVHVALGDYLQRDESWSWLFETPVWISLGDVSLALGQDGQPRMVTFDGDSLVLSTREIAWLDKFSLMPVVAR